MANISRRVTVLVSDPGIVLTIKQLFPHAITEVLSTAGHKAKHNGNGSYVLYSSHSFLKGVACYIHIDSTTSSTLTLTHGTNTLTPITDNTYPWYGWYEIEEDNFNPTELITLEEVVAT